MAGFRVGKNQEETQIAKGRYYYQLSDAAFFCLRGVNLLYNVEGISPPSLLNTVKYFFLF